MSEASQFFDGNEGPTYELGYSAGYAQGLKDGKAIFDQQLVQYVDRLEQLDQRAAQLEHAIGVTGPVLPPSPSLGGQTPRAGSVTRTTPRQVAMLECGHHEATDRNGTWYRCAICKTWQEEA